MTAMNQHHHTKRFGALLIFSLITVLWACAQASEPEVDPGVDQKESVMNPAPIHIPEASAIPPIDAAVPAQLQTATFGLG
jgi:hypothetical protein